MLLVTFHGGNGKKAITNAHAYDTPTGQLNTETALNAEDLGAGAELRGLAYDAVTRTLYVVDGAKTASQVLSFAPPAKGATQYVFDEAAVFIGPSLNRHGLFQSSIGHPYSLALDTASNCYVSNQDTNTVALVQAGNDGKTGTLPVGCQSPYLIEHVAESHAFLDGTFAASQTGALPGVEPNKAPPDVPQNDGGLAMSLAPSGKKKVQHSVRDVAVHGDVLLVCDEPDKVLRLYQLSDGSYLGSSPALDDAPTHLAIFQGWLYVSAGHHLYASPLTAAPKPSELAFTEVLPKLKHGKKPTIGGCTFDAHNNVMYVVQQFRTPSPGTGTIWSFDVSAGSAPSLSNETEFATGFADMPEFVLYLTDP